MGCYTTQSTEQGTCFVCFRADIRPYIRGEGAQLLDALPALGYVLQRRRWQRPLAAVVEVSLITQCWTEIAEVIPVCLGQGRRQKGTSAIVKARSN